MVARDLGQVIGPPGRRPSRAATSSLWLPLGNLSSCGFRVYERCDLPVATSTRLFWELRRLSIVLMRISSFWILSRRETPTSLTLSQRALALLKDPTSFHTEEWKVIGLIPPFKFTTRQA
ncbi:hypothetical protein EVAR_44291_1 [Eumeta japonica]|uniref:Uncharacterized protein n=1 Tax=Eumeta variegata TaxID=151549 RepID=A0A4C1WR05_EUMVA|nr:hypothetical protein EVAR_44291_1 [Eumeta japonica]